MNNLFSVKLLFKSTATSTIFLVKGGSLDEVCNIVIKHFEPETYVNADGGINKVELVKILDVFELVDDLNESLNLKEVYSRYIIFENPSTTAEEAIEKYSLDK